MKRCAACGSADVQILKLCWVDANDLDATPELDAESEPGVMGYSSTSYCRACQQHPELYDDDDDDDDATLAEIAAANGRGPDWSPCTEGCPGWAYFSVNRKPWFEVQRCDQCDRFADDAEAIAHVLALLRAGFERDPGHAVRLLTEGGTPAQYEELGP